MKDILNLVQHQVLEKFGTAGVKHKNDRQLELTINFQPDWLTNSGLLVLDAIARDQQLRSQFETKISNGSLTGYFGGARWAWESKAFGGLYDDCIPSDRPKYGALNYRMNKSGASPRFGSSYLKLKTHVLERTTFCYPESWIGPLDYGIGDRVQNLILLADSNPMELLDPLDHYIEAHIHGSLEIGSDIESLVLDPCYKGTDIEFYASQLDCDVDWHLGFELSVAEMERYPDYRGEESVKLARLLAVNGEINPRIIGTAMRKGLYELQDLKKVWHYLARFGDLNRQQS